MSAHPDSCYTVVRTIHVTDHRIADGFDPTDEKILSAMLEVLRALKQDAEIRWTGDRKELRLRSCGHP